MPVSITFETPKPTELKAPTKHTQWFPWDDPPKPGTYVVLVASKTSNELTHYHGPREYWFDVAEWDGNKWLCNGAYSSMSTPPPFESKSAKVALWHKFGPHDFETVREAAEAVESLVAYRFDNGMHVWFPAVVKKYAQLVKLKGK